MNNMRDAFDGPLFVQLIGFVVFIAFILLSIDQNGANLNVDFIFCLNCLVAESFMNFISCYYSDYVCDQFYDMADIAYAVNWYKFSLNEQRYIQLIVLRAQKRFKLTGCKMFVCSMETYLQVIVYRFILPNCM